ELSLDLLHHLPVAAGDLVDRRGTVGVQRRARAGVATVATGGARGDSPPLDHAHALAALREPVGEGTAVDAPTHDQHLRVAGRGSDGSGHGGLLRYMPGWWSCPSTIAPVASLSSHAAPVRIRRPGVGIGPAGPPLNGASHGALHVTT